MKVLVTGASRGVGAAVTRYLAARGHELVGVYRRARSDAEAVQADAPTQIHMCAADLATEAGIAAVLAAVEGPLDGVVFNAGFAMRAPFEAREVDGIDPLTTQLDIDLVAPLRLARALLAERHVASPASWVFVSSNLARHGLAGKVAYGAAKAGIEAAVRGLCKELGPRGVRVNAVAPGLLRTDMTAATGAAGFAAYATEVPLGRVGEASDIAPVVDFLLGPGAAYISGQVIDVDGGWGA